MDCLTELTGWYRGRFEMVFSNFESRTLMDRLCLFSISLIKFSNFLFSLRDRTRPDSTAQHSQEGEAHQLRRRRQGHRGYLLLGLGDALALLLSLLVNQFLFEGCAFLRLHLELLLVELHQFLLPLLLEYPGLAACGRTAEWSGWC